MSQPTSRERGLEKLPEAHAELIRLRDAGWDADVIAEHLGIPVEAIGPLLRVAEVKLARAMAEGTPAGDDPD